MCAAGKRVWFSRIASGNVDSPHRRRTQVRNAALALKRRNRPERAGTSDPSVLDVFPAIAAFRTWKVRLRCFPLTNPTMNQAEPTSIISPTRDPALMDSEQREERQELGKDADKKGAKPPLGWGQKANQRSEQNHH